MNKDVFSQSIRRFLTPVLVILLGAILVFSPDSASILIAKLLGWAITIVGIGFGIGAVLSANRRAFKVTVAILCAMVGGYLASHPLFLAASIGRIVGAVLLVRSIGDILEARKAGIRFLLPILLAVVGMILVLMPMTTSRLLFRFCGILVLVLGVAMLLDRAKRRGLNPPKDEIIDAL